MCFSLEILKIPIRLLSSAARYKNKKRAQKRDAVRGRKRVKKNTNKIEPKDFQNRKKSFLTDTSFFEDTARD